MERILACLQAVEAVTHARAVLAALLDPMAVAASGGNPVAGGWRCEDIIL